MWREKKRIKMPSSLGEEATRKYLETKFGKEFPKDHPEFLRFSKKKGGKGRKLELDGYCKELKIAFEYNGKQHYKPVEKFKMGPTEVQYQKQSDDFKHRECITDTIWLIVVPNVPHQKVPEWLDHYFEAIDNLNIALQGNKKTSEKVQSSSNFLHLKQSQCIGCSIL